MTLEQIKINYANSYIRVVENLILPGKDIMLCLDNTPLDVEKVNYDLIPSDSDYYDYDLVDE